MHRVNSKRRRAAALRFVAYSVTLTLTVITTVVLLYIALGYRIDRESGHVVRSGLLLVNSKPEAASVYVNNELKDASAPSRFVLSAGNYNVLLKREGYHDWAKTVKVAASGVREVNYPLLVPTQLTPRELRPIGTPALVSQSQNRQFLVTHQSGQSSLTLIKLDAEDPQLTTLPLTNLLSRPGGQVGTLRVVEWALNSKFILLEHTVPSGIVEYLSVSVENPDESVNITRLYNDAPPLELHYVGGNTDEVYGIVGSVLSRYQLKERRSEVVMQDVIKYQPYSDDTVLFMAKSANQGAEIGIRHDKVTTIIQDSVDPASVPLLKYANYDDHFYFVVGFVGGKTITVYRDPLKKPILAKQLPLKTLEFEGLAEVSMSDSSQFVMLQSGGRFLTYDLEDLLEYRVTLPFELAPGSKLTWIDGHHILAMNKENIGTLMDYDGQNQQRLLDSRAGTVLYFAGNYQHLYRLTSADSVKLEVASLVYNQQ